MTFIGMPLEDAQEKEPVPEGEYDCIIKSAEIVDSKAIRGQENIRVMIEVTDSDFPNTPMIFHYLAGLHPDDDDVKRNNKLLQTKAFLNLFNIPYSGGFALEDMQNQEAKCHLVQEEYNGRISNKIQVPW